MKKGLDRFQKTSKEKSISKIQEFLKQKKLARFSGIVKSSGVSDRSTVRKRLDEAISDGRISKTQLFYCVDKGKRGTYYYNNPPDFDIQQILKKEDFRSKIGQKYYKEVLDDVPIFLKYLHKLKLLNEEFNNTYKWFDQQNAKKSSDQLQHIKYFKQETQELILDLYQFAKEFTESTLLQKNDSVVIDWFTDAAKQVIQLMDRYYSLCKVLKKSKFSGLSKSLLAGELMKYSIRHVMIQQGAKPKAGSNLKKMLFNSDGSVKIEIINKINVECLGHKEYLPYVKSGESLEKIRKELSD
ncbi:MAG TPA: hypothetical protein VFG24_00550 [Nitrosopumilaceae archaeon]|nr:hypothetical protein [Nitrosopumilaceae archaeon]